MLNWDNPLQNTVGTSTPKAKALPAAEAEQALEVGLSARDTDRHPHAGDGLVDNHILMATAGAAPSVNPDPMSIAEPAADYDSDAEAGATGLESL